MELHCEFQLVIVGLLGGHGDMGYGSSNYYLPIPFFLFIVSRELGSYPKWIA